MHFGLGLILTLVLAFFVFTFIIPILTTFAETGDIKLSEADMQVKMQQVYVPAYFIYTYIGENVPKDVDGLLKEPCYTTNEKYECALWFNAAGSEFRNRQGEAFVDALVGLGYHTSDFCEPRDKCEKLKSCINNRDYIFEGTWSELSDSEKKQKNSKILDCLQVVVFFVDRYKFMMENQEYTSSWDRMIP